MLKELKNQKMTFYQEWGEIIDNFKFLKCIIIWIPFNEAWGQFDTEQVAEFTNKKDPLRLLTPASGGNHRLCGNIVDRHNYPGPIQTFKIDSLINVLGEYGGLALEINEHIWKQDNWGYAVLGSKEELTQRYIQLIDEIIGYIWKGISAAIYTQTTDVESKINGLLTYDREVTKVFERRIRAANEKIIYSLKD